MVQKIIRIGSSAGVTIPKKQLDALRLQVGDEVEISIKPSQKSKASKVELVELTQRLIKRHEQALKNLSQR